MQRHMSWHVQSLARCGHAANAYLTHAAAAPVHPLNLLLACRMNWKVCHAHTDLRVQQLKLLLLLQAANAMHA